ncbi:MAG TPA: GNAT family N-acetyltransferase [Kofleriaceae bacterium]|nr:GNAT family N-acetyltransferase [Kofleriaceae bacterium]
MTADLPPTGPGPGLRSNPGFDDVELDRRTALHMRTARLVLRTLRPSDADRVSSILSQPDVGRMLGQIHLPYLVDEARRWLESHEEERARGTAYRFGAVLDDRVIGCADIGAIAEQTGELGFWFDPACWGQGYAREAATAVVRFAFAGLEIRRLTATRASDNERSARLLKTLGFRETGQRQAWSHSRRATVTQIAYDLIAPAGPFGLPGAPA